MRQRHEGDDKRGMLVGGLVVTGIGAFFLLSNLGLIPDVGELWPVFLIIVGVALILGSFKSPGRPPQAP